MIPTVTVLIPIWNAGPQFPETIAAIQRQRVDAELEIVVIDSGSTDGTVEFLRRCAGVRLLEIPNSEFNHGLTRDLGIRQARGSIVVLLAQDALPADDQWLQRLIDGFADTHVAGVYSRQQPRPDASPFIRNRLQKWMPPNEAPRVQSVSSAAELDKLSPSEQLRRVVFDNVSAAVRKEVALQIPFGACRFGEDVDWSRRVIRAGYKIIYEPGSCVFHSHDHSTWYEFKRAYLDHQNRHRLFGITSIRGLPQLLQSSIADTKYFLKVVARDPTLGSGDRIKWWSRAFPFAVSQNLGQYLGTRSVRALERRNKFYRAVDRALARGV